MERGRPWRWAQRAPQACMMLAERMWVRGRHRAGATGLGSRWPVLLAVQPRAPLPVNVSLSACDRPPCMHAATAGRSATVLSPPPAAPSSGTWGQEDTLASRGCHASQSVHSRTSHFRGRFYHLQVEVILKQTPTGSG